MSNNKQTSVEQLFHKLWDEPKDKFTWYAMLKEHMVIHKEEIEDAFWNGDNTDCTSEQNIKDFAEQYYNETYGGGEQ
jgi:hypothetical protein